MNSATPLSILFVDDEPRILDGLRRQLRLHRAEWDMRFVESGEAAVEALSTRGASVVVSDMRMPGMSGAQLLRIVQKRWPDTLRVILSGQTDQTELLCDIGAIHQFLQKPCEPEVLLAAIRRAQRVASVLESPALRRIGAGVTSLPLVPETYHSLIRALDTEASAGEISAIVESDVALKTKLIQIVNSSFFGSPRQNCGTREAVTLLGTNALRAIAVTAHAFDAIGDEDCCCPLIRQLWVESVRIGALAQGIARRAHQSPEVAEQAMLAGTLSLVGRALIARYEPLAFQQALSAASRGTPLYEAESAACGAPQQHVGGYALGLWAFSDQVIEAVTYQATPSASSVRTAAHPLAYVHAARSLCDPAPYVEAIPLDTDFLNSVQLHLDALGAERRAA